MTMNFPLITLLLSNNPVTSQASRGACGAEAFHPHPFPRMSSHSLRHSTFSPCGKCLYLLAIKICKSGFSGNGVIIKIICYLAHFLQRHLLPEPFNQRTGETI